MSTPLVCSALGIAPDRWPPDHYALLGLRVGEVDAEEVEARVLDRMERLRRYQLSHPDAVTDAMNRLAQALVCLSDPAAKAAYDTERRTVMVREGEAPAEPGRAARREPRPPEPAGEPPGQYALAPPEPLAVAPPVRPPAPRPRPPDARRDIYRRLAATRHLLSAWREVGDYIADPRARLRPAEAIDFVGALLDLRQRLADDAVGPVGLPGQPGAVVTALARQSLPLTAYRRLQPEPRSALAADWQAGEARLAAEYSELGRAVRRHRRAAPPRAVRRLARAIVTDRLDLLMFVLGLAALGLAVLRSR